MRPSLEHVFRFVVPPSAGRPRGRGRPRHAWALTWPDVEERVERDLAAADPVTHVGRRPGNCTNHRTGAGGPLALASLDDPDDEVRLAAAEAAIRLRAAGAPDADLAWLNAQDARLRHTACEVARALPSPRVVAPLARSLGDPDAEVRAEAAEALGYQASPDAVPPLLGRLDDPTPSVRVRIVAALARLKDTRAVVPLSARFRTHRPKSAKPSRRRPETLATGERRPHSCWRCATRRPKSGETRLHRWGACARATPWTHSPRS